MQNLLSTYDNSNIHPSLNFSFQHLITNGYFLWIISINKRQRFFRTKQSRTVLTEAAQQIHQLLQNHRDQSTELERHISDEALNPL